MVFVLPERLTSAASGGMESDRLLCSFRNSLGKDREEPLGAPWMEAASYPRAWQWTGRPWRAPAASNPANGETSAGAAIRITLSKKPEPLSGTWNTPWQQPRTRHNRKQDRPGLFFFPLNVTSGSLLPTKHGVTTKFQGRERRAAKRALYCACVRALAMRAGIFGRHGRGFQ